VADQCCSFTELAPRLHEPSLRQSTYCHHYTPTTVPTHTTVQTHLNLTSTGGRLLSRGNQGDLMSSSSSSRPLIVISQNRLMIDVSCRVQFSTSDVTIMTVIGTSPIIFDVVKKRISRPSPEKPTSNVTVKKSSH
jgi:hypothetical protein